MDQDEEVQRFKQAAIAVVLVLISGYVSWKELKFKLWGKTADALVTQVKEYERRGRYGRRSQMRQVDFNFAEEDGTRRQESYSASADDPSPDKTILVQYLAGAPGSARPVGSENMLGVLFFIGSLAWGGFTIWSLAREAKAPYASSRRR